MPIISLGKRSGVPCILQNSSQVSWDKAFTALVFAIQGKDWIRTCLPENNPRSKALIKPSCPIITFSIAHFSNLASSNTIFSHSSQFSTLLTALFLTLSQFGSLVAWWRGSFSFIIKNNQTPRLITSTPTKIQNSIIIANNQVYT